MKVRASEVSIGQCFLQGRSLKKKTADDKAITVKNGKVSTRKLKGDPQVELTYCPLEMLGTGMSPRHPETMIEIGDGNPLKKRRR
jgi:hypothetical protein